MKRTYRIFTLLSILMLSVNACTEDFEQVNTNQGVPTEVNPGLLLPNILYNLATTISNLSWWEANHIMQYTESFGQESWSNGNWEPNTSGGSWSNFYELFVDVQDMYDTAERLGESNYMAIALILKSQIASILTDAWGDVPYSEAGQGYKKNLLLPRYDSQANIYTGMLADLLKANELIDEQQGLVYGGDNLYNGDAQKWKKFSNSLRLRLLLRVSKKPEMNSASEISTMVNDPDTYPIFSGNDDEAVYVYRGTVPDISPIYQLSSFAYFNRKIAGYLADKLIQFNDPRLQTWAAPTPSSANTASPEYRGLPSSLTTEESFAYAGGENNLSPFRESTLRVATLPSIFMSHAELQFVLAEAAQRGMINKSAKEHYEAGVQSSFSFWKTTMPADYLQRPGIIYDGQLETLFNQKYIALFFSGFEPWFDYRRSGLPVLTFGPNHQNGGKMPSRFMYPTIEQSLNAENYKEAASRIGGDDINKKGWWESN